jgi:hypothetical protein
MNMVQGRYQVTKGVCVSKAVSNDILVMDLEGTDSKERGEENVVCTQLMNVIVNDIDNNPLF